MIGQVSVRRHLAEAKTLAEIKTPVVFEKKEGKTEEEWDNEGEERRGRGGIGRKEKKKKKELTPRSVRPLVNIAMLLRTAGLHLELLPSHRPSISSQTETLQTLPLTSGPDNQATAKISLPQLVDVIRPDNSMSKDAFLHHGRG